MSHKNKIRLVILFTIFILVSIGIFALDFALNTLGANWYFEYEALHSALEMLGAVAAILMAIVLFQKENRGNKENFFLAMGFLSMGILDGFHSIFLQGDRFVFLHSAASLIGSFFFFLVWLPPSILKEYTFSKKYFLWLTTCLSIMLGTCTLLFPESLPVMIENGGFTPGAKGMNFLAGIFFLIAGLWFLLDYYRSNKSESYLFIYLMATDVSRDTQ